MHKTQQENTQKTAQNTNNNTIKLLTVNNWLINGKKNKIKSYLLCFSERMR